MCLNADGYELLLSLGGDRDKRGAEEWRLFANSPPPPPPLPKPFPFEVLVLRVLSLTSTGCTLNGGANVGNSQWARPLAEVEVEDLGLLVIPIVMLLASLVPSPLLLLPSHKQVRVYEVDIFPFFLSLSLMLRIAYGVLCPRAHHAAQLTVTTPTASLLRSVDKNSGKFSSDANSGTGGIGEDIYGPMEAGFSSQQDGILAQLGCATGKGYLDGV